MNNLKKLIGTISKILFALMLALALVNVTSCDNMLDFGGSSQGNTPTKPSNPDDDNSQTTDPNVPPKNHYSDYENFNKADYPIVNESGKSDSEIAELKDLIWLMYAENEDAGEWTANYIKTNKIKTILKEGDAGWAWISPDQLDRFYLSTSAYGWYESLYKESDDNDRTPLRKDMFSWFTHETMHLVQYKSNAFNLMTGMRPDICAAADMLTEFLAWFYAGKRNSGAYVSADMENAVATQSKYMILSTDPWAYDDACAKDPSLPDPSHTAPWFNNNLSTYAQHAFTSELVRESAMTAPLRQAGQEDMLRVARAMLACRDPKQAGVTDEALWTVFDALRKVATGNSKYLKFNDNGNWAGASRDSFNNFQEVIANWDAAYAKQ